MTFRGTKMSGIKKLISGSLVTAILVGSGVAFAHIDSNQTVTETQPIPKITQPAKSSAPAQSTQRPETTTTTNGPCTTTTTKDVDSTPPNTHNNTTTTTDCHSS